MTNYQYKGVDINNIISGINSATRSTIITRFPDLSIIPQIDSVFTSTTIKNSEMPGYTAYKCDQVDISTYCIAKYTEFTTSGSYSMSTMMGTTMATRMMAVLIGGGGAGGAGTNNQYKAAQNQHYQVKQSDSYVNVYNTGFHSENVYRGQSQTLNQNVDVSVKFANGIRRPIVQVRGGRGTSGVNANANTTAFTHVNGNLKLALQQVFQQTVGDNNWGDLTCNHAINLTIFKIPKANGQFANVILNSYVQPYMQTNNSFVQHAQSFFKQNVLAQTFTWDYTHNHYNADNPATNEGRTAGTAGTEGKFVLLSSLVTQANINVNVGAAVTGVAANTGQTGALAGNPTSITIGGTTYQSAQTTGTPLLLGASSTNQYSTTLNSYGLGGRGGDPGVTGSANAGQSGGDGVKGYVRVYLYYDQPNPVYTGGDYTNLGSNTGSATDFPSIVQCIWNVPNFKYFSHAAGPYILLNYTFNYTGANNIGTYKIIVDDYAYVFFNGTAPTMSVWSGLYSGSIQLVNGINYIQAIVYNTGGGVGFVASFFDSGSNLVAYTNNGWTSQTLATINTSATAVHLPVVGGLWTTLYNNTQYYSKSGSNSISDINNQSYYYTDIANLSKISSSVVTNFSALSNINSSLTLNWGFKSTGFIVVPTSTSGRWTFSITADDIAQLWIGTTTNTSGVAAAICPSSTSNILVAYLGGTVSYAVTLNTEIYYPILIYWGQITGGQNFSLTVTNPSGQIVTHSTIFYYVNAAPSY